MVQTLVAYMVNKEDWLLGRCDQMDNCRRRNLEEAVCLEKKRESIHEYLPMLAGDIERIGRASYETGCAVRVRVQALS